MSEQQVTSPPQELTEQQKQADLIGKRFYQKAQEFTGEKKNSFRYDFSPQKEQDMTREIMLQFDKHPFSDYDAWQVNTLTTTPEGTRLITTSLSTNLIDVPHGSVNFSIDQEDLNGKLIRRGLRYIPGTGDTSGNLYVYDTTKLQDGELALQEGSERDDTIADLTKELADMEKTVNKYREIQASIQ